MPNRTIYSLLTSTCLALFRLSPVPLVRLSNALVDMAIIDRFMRPEVGAEYGVRAKEKRALIRGMKDATYRIESATSWISHLVLTDAILRIPKSVQGDIVECGCWKGASTASLSLVAALVGRKLLVCDSFAGLPADAVSQVHVYPHLNVYGYYREGMYASNLDTVRENIRRWGNLDVCEFVVGYFHESLAAITRPVVLAFLDVDLVSSLQDCIKSIWPRLHDNCCVFTDDSCDMSTARVWFDDSWWQRELKCASPGYVGSGCGLPLSVEYSSLGYTRKISDPVTQCQKISWLYYDN